MATRKIRNKKTGQIIEIDENQAGQYGLAGTGTTPIQTPTPPATTFPQESIVTPPTSTGMDINNPGFSEPTPQKYVTGRSLEEHQQALNKARAAGDKVAEADITADYTREFQYQKEYMASPEGAKQKESKQLKSNTL